MPPCRTTNRRCEPSRADVTKTGAESPDTTGWKRTCTVEGAAELVGGAAAVTVDTSTKSAPTAVKRTRRLLCIQCPFDLTRGDRLSSEGLEPRPQVLPVAAHPPAGPEGCTLFVVIDIDVVVQFTERLDHGERPTKELTSETHGDDRCWWRAGRRPPPPEPHVPAVGHRQAERRTVAVDSGSPLCQDMAATAGVGSAVSPGSDRSEVLIMGIGSA